MDRESRILAIACLCAAALAPVPAAAQGFNGAKEKVTLHRKLPALVHLPGDTVKVTVTSADEDGALPYDFQAMLETELLKDSIRICAATTSQRNRSSARSPSTRTPIPFTPRDWRRGSRSARAGRPDQERDQAIGLRAHHGQPERLLSGQDRRWPDLDFRQHQRRTTIENSTARETPRPMASWARLPATSAV